jgi:two-component system, cell cycle sensor histidine kinase and response regulator CckA
MSGSVRVLIVDKDPQRAENIRKELRKAKVVTELAVADSSRTLADALEERTDVIISAFFQPGIGSLDILRLIREKELKVPLIVVATDGDEEMAVECLKQGASDYIPIAHLFRLNDAIRAALDTAEAARRKKHIDRALQFTRFAYDRISIGIYWLNEQGQFLLVNASGSNTLGYTEKEMYERTIADIDVQFDQSKWQQAVAYLRDDPIWRFESQYKKKQGATLPVEVTIHYLKMEGQDYFLVYALDITKRKKSEEDFQRMEKEVFQAKKMDAIGKLAGGVAHEFNNMLTIILSSAELLLQKADPQSEQHLFAEQIVRAGHRAAAQTTQLLAFSKKQTFERKILDLNAILSDMMKWVKRLIRENITLTSDLNKNIGNVLIDPGELGQIIINLVINAGDAMPAGGDLLITTKKVTLTQKYCQTHVGARPGDFLVITVQDSGSGMDEETRSHIFEPYFTTKLSGTGLGLSIVYGIVQQNGGHIECDSVMGKGSIFRVFLPWVNEQHSQVDGPTAFDRLPRGRETVLLVEDEPDVRSITLRLLEHQGYRVLSAQHGVEALALLDAQKEQVDLLITDVIMPYMNGAELAKKMLQRNKSLKVLYMSAYPDGVVFSKHNVNVQDAYFIGKPFGVEAFVVKVRQVLDSR